MSLPGGGADRRRGTRPDPLMRPQTWAEIVVYWVVACVFALGTAWVFGIALDVPVAAAALLVVVVCRERLVGLVAVDDPLPAPRAVVAEPPPPDRRLARLTWALRTAGEPAAWRDEVRPVLATLVAGDPTLRDDPDVARTLALDTPPSARALRALIDRIDHP